MSSPMSVEVRTDFAMARGNHLVETAKFTLAILFGTAVVLAFASEQVLAGPLSYALTALIISVCIFGILGLDGSIQDIKAGISDMTPEEQETNIGKVATALPFGLYRILIIVIYVAIGLTQLIMIYS